LFKIDIAIFVELPILIQFAYSSLKMRTTKKLEEFSFSSYSNCCTSFLLGK